MKQVFDFQEPYYNLRSETSQFRRENMKITHYDMQSVKNLGPKIWAWYLKMLKTVNLCKNLRDWLNYGNLKLSLADCEKSTLQIFVSFD